MDLSKIKHPLTFTYLTFAVMAGILVITTGRYAAFGQSSEYAADKDFDRNQRIALWEYKVPNIIYNSSNFERDLNKLGDAGWELIHIEDGGQAIFKRQKNEVSDPHEKLDPESASPVPLDR